MDSVFQKSYPDAQAKNEVDERKHGQLIEMVHNLLLQACLPPQSWVDARYTAIFTIDPFPTPTLQFASPMEKPFGKLPDYTFLRILRCESFPNFSASSQNKLHTCLHEMIFPSMSLKYATPTCHTPPDNSIRVILSYGCNFFHLLLPLNFLPYQYDLSLCHLVPMHPHHGSSAVILQAFQLGLLHNPSLQIPLHLLLLQCQNLHLPLCALAHLVSPLIRPN